MNSFHYTRKKNCIFAVFFLEITAVTCNRPPCQQNDDINFSSFFFNAWQRSTQKPHLSGWTSLKLAYAATRWRCGPRGIQHTLSFRDLVDLSGAMSCLMSFILKILRVLCFTFWVNWQLIAPKMRHKQVPHTHTLCAFESPWIVVFCFHLSFAVSHHCTWHIYWWWHHFRRGSASSSDDFAPSTIEIGPKDCSILKLQGSWSLPGPPSRQ